MDLEVLAKATFDQFSSPEMGIDSMDSRGGGSQGGSPGVEKVTEETKEAIRKMMSKALFIDCTEEEAAAGGAPVMIVQHSPYNIYSVLKAYLRPEYVYGVEKFWVLVRQDGALPRKTWRPRLQSAQIKSLQNTRYPKTREEWNRVMEMALKTERYFQVGLTYDDFFCDLRTFINGFEMLWTRERQHILSQSRKKRAKVEEESDDGDYLEPEDSDQKSHESKMPKLKVMQKQAAVPDGFFRELDNTANKHNAPKDHANKFNPTEKKTNKGHTEIEVALDTPPCPSLVQQSTDRPCASQTVIYLLVGGREFATTLATLESVPDSFFSRLAKNGSNENREKRHENFFIDRSPEMFSYILEYLRARRYGETSGLSLPVGEKDLEHLLREAVFYDLGDYAVTIRKRLALAMVPIMDFVVVTSQAVEQSQLEQTVLLMTQQCNQLVHDKICRSNCILSVVDQKLNTFLTPHGQTRVQIIASLRSS